MPKYTVRGFLLSQHMTPHVKLIVETKDLALAMAEVLIEEPHLHYVTIMNDQDDELLTYQKPLDL